MTTFLLTYNSFMVAIGTELYTGGIRRLDIWKSEIDLSSNLNE